MHSLSRSSLYGAVSASLLVLASGDKSTGSDTLDYVNPLIGTANGGMYLSYGVLSLTCIGHVFPGANLPFGTLFLPCACYDTDRIGMVKAVSDTNGANQGGFAHDSNLVTGFSHMHDSGTGGVSLIVFVSTNTDRIVPIHGKFPHLPPAVLPPG